MGTAYVKQVTDKQLERVILVFLVGVGLVLMVEAFLQQETLAGFLPATLTWRLAVGVEFGLVIGLLRSMLGVAGGELIIPIPVFTYGVEIKAAGSISLAISLPTVLVGIIRHTGYVTGCPAFGW